MHKNWEYGGVYHQYKMDGIIELPNDSKVKVCDLTIELPSFMLEADCIFIDPPCSTGNLKSFHYKAEKVLDYSFNSFQELLFQRIVQINPKHLFIEVFKSNKDAFLDKCKEMYVNVNVYDSFYYNSRSKKCWIIHCTNESENTYYPALNDIDEAKAIAWICKNHQFDCIGDLCMGRGLVGQRAFDNNKKFVGTELNAKRLAILVDYVIKKHENTIGK